MPLDWDDVPDVEAQDFTLATVPALLVKQGDPSAAIDDEPGTLKQLLELAARDEAEGLGDAPWPPHFRKQKGEPKRVQPSRDRDRPKQPGRIGDPQPPGRGGKQPPPQGQRRPKGSAKRTPRTGQGRPEEFDD
jgi:hypothetical protein